MGRIADRVRMIVDAAPANAALPEILRLAEDEGILDRMRRLSPFTAESLCRALERELGYALPEGNRRRMILILVDILSECGWVRREKGAWRWLAGPVPSGSAPTDDHQYLFFRECLASVPAYLRGAPPTVTFDAKHAAVWERFLGCAEFEACRHLLLDMLGIEDVSSFRLLDLCHGPGWGVASAAAKYPAIGITALDFTDAFACAARLRVRDIDERNRAQGRQHVNVTWRGPEAWKGFGHPLPFRDGSFNAVFFSCGDPYIPHERRPDVYEEIRRVLAPGGKLGILTRGYPDPEARHVPSFRIRMAALVHDFAESVCEGWEGFPDVEENLNLFAGLGFRAGGALFGGMSFLESSLWILAKEGPHA